MNNPARSNILARLKATRVKETPPQPSPYQGREQEIGISSYSSPDKGRLGGVSYDWNTAERIRRFTERMTAVRAEVHQATAETWLDVLEKVCKDKGLTNLLIAPQTALGSQIQAQAARFPALKAYDQPIESWKQDMFYGIDAAFTSTHGGIAETGTLIVMPTADEPRLMSLVPPIHIALLDSRQLYTTFAEAVQEQAWVQNGMPTNALLISGPSKSADIEQTLAYGVHGPKELVVIVLT